MYRIEIISRKDNMNKRRVHDGIAGALITVGTGLGYYIDSAWLLVPGILGLILVQSAFTGFCPVYYTLEKIESDNKS